jgi:hypothetical protein
MRYLKTKEELRAEGRPNAGAHQPKHKTSECESVITDAKVLKTTPEVVKDAVEVPGLVRKAIDTQVQTAGDEGGGGSNPKHRDSNSCGAS